MSQKTETICDMCGARKGESNHWWIVQVLAGETFRVCYPRTVPSVENQLDYCSEGCVSKALSQFMSGSPDKRSLEDEMVDELDSMLEEIPNGSI